MSKAQSYQDRRDNRTNWRLHNWARAINSQWQDGPKERPKCSSWHGLVEKKYVDDDVLPTPIDEDDALRVQASMIVCMDYNMRIAKVLTQHYRDGFYLGRKYWPMLRTARNKFWRFL